MYKDVVRVHSLQRGDMKNGEIVRVTVTKNEEGKSKSILFAIRGHEESELQIGIDFVGCQKLKVKTGKIYEFKFERGGFRDRLTWARESSDPGARIAMFIAYWSAIIGLIGFVLGVIGAVPVLVDFGAWVYKKTTEIHSKVESD
jgi:hypothetical protein